MIDFQKPRILNSGTYCETDSVECFVQCKAWQSLAQLVCSGSLNQQGPFEECEAGWGDGDERYALSQPGKNRETLRILN